MESRRYFNGAKTVMLFAALWAVMLGLGSVIGNGQYIFIFAGLSVIGTAIAASGPGYYYDGYRRCGWVRQFDAFGNYIGRVRTCSY